tara:strand:- start:228 stop:1436 length:1209 start_codon:yes stop_codon:yes gene_type:complete
MGKIIFRLRSSLNKDVSIYVYLRGSGKQIETKTGYSINPKYWNEDNSKPIRSHSLYSDVTRLELYLLGRINEASEVGTNIDSRWLKKQINDHFNRVDGDKDPLLVLNFFNDFITKSLAECEAGVGMKRITIRGYRTFYNILLEYEEDIGESIRFDKLDKFFFEDFYSWMLQEKKYKPSNINRHISRLKSICREAASYGTTVNPMYASFKTKKINQQRYLTIITTKDIYQEKPESSIKNLNKSVSDKNLFEDLYEESLVFGSTDYFKLENKIIRQFKEALKSRKLEECFLVNVRSMADMLKISGSTNVGNGFYDFIWGDVSQSKEDEELKNKIKQSYSDHYLLIEQLDLLKSKLTGKKHIERLKWDIEAAKARLLATATAAKVIGLTGKDLPVGGKLFDSFKS